MNCFLHLRGGGLDGCFLPVHPRYAEAPNRLLVYHPAQQSWLVYGAVYGEGQFPRESIVDVYKIPDGAEIPASCPDRQAKICGLSYDGLLAPDEAAALERITRERQRSGDCDVQKLR
jgi:hypothetical protein